MTKIGCHVSIAGGIVNAPKQAADLECEVFQMFTRSPQGGPAPALTKKIVEKFREEMKRCSQENCYIHTPYYINFASSKKATRESSAKIVREELERGSLIGAKYIMTHLGSSRDFTRLGVGSRGGALARPGNSVEEGLKMTAEGIGQVLNDYKGTTKLLLEISAGAGSVIGSTFEELYQILEYLKFYDTMIYHRIGICLDSAHMFASGYNIKTEESFEKVIAVIKKTVGLERIKLIHANDSKIELGGRKDRHDHIDHGKIGEEGFVNLMSAFSDTDFICETQPDLVKEDIEKLKQIRYNTKHDK